MKTQIGKVCPVIVKGESGILPICFQCSEKIKASGITDLHEKAKAKKELIRFIMENEYYNYESNLNRMDISELQAKKTKIIERREFDELVARKIESEFIEEETESYLHLQYGIVEHEDLQHELQFDEFFKNDNNTDLWNHCKFLRDNNGRYSTVNVKVGNKYFVLKLYLSDGFVRVTSLEYLQVPKFPQIFP